MANQKLNKSIQYMMATGEFRDEMQAMKILKASLRALRDRLPKTEAFHLGTMLPETLRDSYFEGWHNGQRQAESMNKSDFLAEVEDHIIGGFKEHSVADLVPVALKSVLNMISGDEAIQIRESLPISIQNIFEDGQSMD